MKTRTGRARRGAWGLALMLAASPLHAAPKTQAAAVDTISTVVPKAERASWLSDRRLLRPGDLLTVIVDERTQARERVSQTATSDHGLDAQLNANVGTNVRLGPAKVFGTSLSVDSRDLGEANRQGDLNAVMTVTVLSIDPAGIARVHGTRHVSVDGREQVIELAGRVRSADVQTGNLVSSSRVADALVTLNGKKIGPHMGFLGKLLAMLWP